MYVKPENEEFLTQATFRISDIRDLFPNDLSMWRRIASLTKEKRIAKIKNGLYATLNPLTGHPFADQFVLGTAMFDDCYVAYHSALEFHGFGHQAYTEVQLMSDTRHTGFLHDGLSYRFYRSTIDSGVDTLHRTGPVKVTSLERTVVDCLDRIDCAGGLEELFMCVGIIPYLSEGKLRVFLKEYDKKSLYQKAGFVLSITHGNQLPKEFFEECLSHIPSRPLDLRENKKAKWKSDRKWKVLYPTYLTNEEN